MRNAIREQGTNRARALGGAGEWFELQWAIAIFYCHAL